MGLFVPSANDFKLQISSHGATRPAATFGALHGPAQNTKGTWIQVLAGASLTQDAYAILININSIAVSAVAKDCILDIGVDPAGGTSYTVKIADLLVSCASPYNVGSGGVWYYFPLWFKEGTTIAARASANNVTPGTFRCNVSLFCSPRRPESVRVGTFVESLGATGASSSGTVVVPGTTNDGTWTSIAATTRSAWWWQLGYGTNDTIMTDAAIHADLAADSSGNKMLIENQLICVSSAEQINNSPLTAGCVATVAGGTTIYGRLQSSAAVDSAVSMMAYALG